MIAECIERIGQAWLRRRALSSFYFWNCDILGRKWFLASYLPVWRTFLIFPFVQCKFTGITSWLETKPLALKAARRNLASDSHLPAAAF